MKKKSNRVTRAIFALLLLVSILLPEYTPMVHQAQAAVTQKEIDGLKDEAKDLAKKQSELKSRISTLKNDRAKAIERRNLLDQQILGGPGDVATGDRRRHRGRSGSRQRRHTQGCAAPQIRASDRRALNPFRSAHHRHPAGYPDIPAHADQFIHVAVAVFKQIFLKYGGAPAP